MKRSIGTAAIMAAIGLTALMAQQGKKGNAPKVSPAEGQAVNAVSTAAQQNNPDGVITAAEDLLTRFKDTIFKDRVLMMEAQAYQQKGDYDKAQIYAERALATNPNLYDGALMLADLTLRGTREHDLDRDEKLAKAEKYANQAITSVTAAEKPNPQASDQQWADFKKDTIAQAHDALGRSAIDHKDWERAISELKMAVESTATPQPAYQVRLASAYQSAGKNDEAIALTEKIMNDSQVPQQIRSVAQSVRASAVMAKNGGKPATQNAPPPQVEINRKQ